MVESYGGYQAEALLSGRAMDVYARVSNEDAIPGV